MSDIPAGLIGGRYRVGDVLGTGGSASVFAAIDTVSGAAVALKILHPHLGDSVLAREAILTEAVAASELRHPNVVSSFDAGVHDIGEGSLAWIAMERVSGLTLLDLVQFGGPLSIEHTIVVAEAVLRALDVAHRVGLIHRDVSPSNVMISSREDGSINVADVRLLDFGLAAAAGNAALGPATDGQGRFAVLGSANYTSPEQAAAEPVDERGDLYQLGGLLHFALTGRPPFPRASVEATIAAHRDAPPPVPSVLRRDTPRAIDRLVVKALLKDPADRFQTAADMLTVVTRLRPVLSTEQLVPGGESPAASRTRVLSTVDRTELLMRPTGQRSTSTPVREAVADSPAPGSLYGAAGSRRAGGWLAGLVVVALVASAWFLAASNTGQVSATPTATPAPTSIPTVSASAPSPPTDGVSTVTHIPSIDMTSLSDARSALTAAGLSIGTLTIQNSAHPGDTVLLVSPAAGSPLAIGGSVDLVVASGSNGVPDVGGLTEGDAVAAVNAAGFAAVLRKVSGTSTPAGTVVSSEPSADTVRRLGSEILLLVSVGAPPTSPPGSTPTPTAPSPTMPPQVE